MNKKLTASALFLPASAALSLLVLTACETIEEPGGTEEVTFEDTEGMSEEELAEGAAGAEDDAGEVEEATRLAEDEEGDAAEAEPEKKATTGSSRKRTADSSAKKQEQLADASDEVAEKPVSRRSRRSEAASKAADDRAARNEEETEALKEQVMAANDEAEDDGNPRASGGAEVEVTDELPVPTGRAYRAADTDKFGPGDYVEMEVYRVDRLSGKFEVNDFGYVDFPLIGEHVVQGKTAKELKLELEEIYGRDYLQNPSIIVSRDPAQIGKFIVDGAVGKTGIYDMYELITLSEAIAMAGGTKDGANLQRVLVLRTVEGKRYVTAFNLQDIRERGGEDPYLYPDDSVYVDTNMMNEAFGDILRSTPLIGMFLR